MTPGSGVKWVEGLISEALKTDLADLECQRDGILTTLARRRKKLRIDKSSISASSTRLKIGDGDGSGGRVSPSGRPPGASLSRKKEGGAAKNILVMDVVGRECLDATHHWCFLLKEMMWMAEDFNKERKRHASLAKKQSKSIEAYIKGQAAREAKSLKDSILALHRIAQRSAREIRSFWGKLERFVAYKQKRLCEDARQKAMDRHLVYLVKQTERYTRSLYSQPRSSGDSLVPVDQNENQNNQNLEDGEAAAAAASSTQTDSGAARNASFDVYSNEDFCNSSNYIGGSVGDLDGDMMSEGTNSSQESLEFQEELDNEETIDHEESLMGGGAQNAAEEISALKLEADLSVEELKKRYGYIAEEQSQNAIAAAQDVKDEEDEDKESVLKTKDEPKTGSADEKRNSYFTDMEESDSSDREFIVTEHEADDEETIAAEEQLTKPQSYSQELSALQLDAETHLDDILHSYGYSGSLGNSAIDAGGGSSDGVTRPSSNETCCSPMEVVKNDEDEFFRSSSIFDHSKGSESGDSDFVGFDEEDDEKTMEEAERLEGKYDVSEEIKRLTADNETPLEDLLKLYRNVEDENGNNSSGVKNEGENATEMMTATTSGSAGTTKESTTSSGDGEGSTSAALVDELNADDALHRLEAMDEKARSIQIERPFLLSKSVKLREYQHSGLNWLASLHERRLNGILADEMGLGKTLQTIALFAYLACCRGIWGPHLIIVPTSCMVTWEIEFKHFCPGFKVLTYYGNAKVRRDLRAGWTKPSAFHVCITSYQLAVADANSFKRKKWYFLVLDEAHNIKNFKSQRWQTLLAFSSQRRLLLTGTPLQNSLMELWSLMHFLMPHIFRR